MIFSEYGLMTFSPTGSLALRTAIQPTVDLSAGLVVMTAAPPPSAPVPPPIVTPPSTGWATMEPNPPLPPYVPPTPASPPAVLPPTLVAPPSALPVGVLPTKDSSKAVLWFGIAAAALLIARKMK